MPPNKKTIVFIDGQNIYHLAKRAWAPRPAQGWSPYSFPSYDVEKLANVLVLSEPGRVLQGIRFYTGVPSALQNSLWHQFWTNKLRHMANRHIAIFKGRISATGQEKGVDVSLAIDLIKLTYEKSYDVAIVVSQDMDFGPAVKLAKEIAKNQHRQLEFYSAFPCEVSNHHSNQRGVPGTAWIHITKQIYDACYDPREYRPNMPI